MTLVYRILWLEDDPSYVESLKPLLKDHLEDYGYDLELQVVSNGNNITEIIENFDCDLILMDYQLTHSLQNGDELIQRIRNQELYTEIIFYSEHPDFKDNITEDGVFFARGRTVLNDKVMKVIDLTIKKSQDVTYMRGLVIAETIDIEMKMDYLLLKYFGMDEEKKAVFEQVLGPNFDVLTLKKKSDLINIICNERIAILNGEYSKLKDNPEMREKPSPATSAAHAAASTL